MPYQYDALGRTTQITRPDGNTALVSYTLAATSIQDEGNGTRRVQRISQVNGLGQPTSVCEVTLSYPPVGTEYPAATMPLLSWGEYHSVSQLMSLKLSPGPLGLVAGAAAARGHRELDKLVIRGWPTSPRGQPWGRQE